MRPLSLKRLLIATAALPAATVALSMSIASPAAATPYAYQFLPGSTTELDVEYGISGGLIANEDPFPTNFQDFSVKLTPLTGHGQYTGTYTEVSASCVASAGFVCAFGTLGSVAQLVIEALAPGFTGASPIALTSVQIVSPPFTLGDVAFDFSPHAELETIPEPTSFAILGAALGLFGLGRRVFRKR